MMLDQAQEAVPFFFSGGGRCSALLVEPERVCDEVESRKAEGGGASASAGAALSYLVPDSTSKLSQRRAVLGMTG